MTLHPDQLHCPLAILHSDLLPNSPAILHPDQLHGLLPILLPNQLLGLNVELTHVVDGKNHIKIISIHDELICYVSLIFVWEIISSNNIIFKTAKAIAIVILNAVQDLNAFNEMASLQSLVVRV